LGSHNTPVGSRHDSPNCRRRTSPRRPRARICLRKGCGRRYQPKRWNQCYCQDPECLRLVRRWQAARRQAERREDDTLKAQHAEAERARRRRAKSLPQASNDPAVAAARGHTAKKISPTPLCGRPGCHDPPLKSGRNRAIYCCRACRQAVRRVLDRELKWLSRGTFRGRPERMRKYKAARACRYGKQHSAVRPTPPRPHLDDQADRPNQSAFDGLAAPVT